VLGITSKTLTTVQSTVGENRISPYEPFQVALVPVLEEKPRSNLNIFVLCFRQVPVVQYGNGLLGLNQKGKLIPVGTKFFARKMIRFGQVRKKVKILKNHKC
jgi:hypothetical protein